MMALVPGGWRGYCPAVGIPRHKAKENSRPELDSWYSGSRLRGCLHYTTVIPTRDFQCQKSGHYRLKGVSGFSLTPGAKKDYDCVSEGHQENSHNGFPFPLALSLLNLSTLLVPLLGLKNDLTMSSFSESFSSEFPLPFPSPSDVPGVSPHKGF